MTRPATVLVVDDHPINRDLMGYLLSLQGHEVEAVEDGASALEALGRPEEALAAVARGRALLLSMRPIAPENTMLRHYLAVSHLARPRIDRPFRRIREHGVGVREEQDAGT